MPCPTVSTSAKSRCVSQRSYLNIYLVRFENQECQTAGGVSPVSLSCTAASTNTITQAGGILGGIDSGSGGKMSFADKGKGNGNGNGNNGISVPTDTQQKQECQTAGGTSPITAYFEYIDKFSCIFSTCCEAVQIRRFELRQKSKIASENK